MGDDVNYSWFCNNCGHAFMSDRKDKVAQDRRNHGHADHATGARVCPRVPLSKPNIGVARPALAAIMEDEWQR